MTKEQVDNIIGFCFNFHIQHMKFEDQTPDYIMEKWDKFIGIKPKSNFINSNYYHLPQLLKKKEICLWIKRWNISEELFLEMKEIIYFICLINEKPLMGLEKGGIYDTPFFSEITDKHWCLSSILSEIGKVIDIEFVNKSKYNNQHQLVKVQINEWLKHKRNNIEYKLNMILV